MPIHAFLNANPEEASAMVAASDQLENVEVLLHSSAYQVVRQTVRLMRGLAGTTAPRESDEPADILALVDTLRRCAPTVAEPASGRMLGAAARLERLL